MTHTTTETIPGIGGICDANVKSMWYPQQDEKVHYLYNDFVIRTTTEYENDFNRAMKATCPAPGDNVSITIDTMAPLTRSGTIGLGDDATRVYHEPNAGGASVVSEALSVEYMHRRARASQTVPEMKIQYSFYNWKKIDYICTISGERIGVSVTRAMGYPDPSFFSMEDAVRLGNKKLYGMVLARSGVSECHNYNRSILHVFCQSQEIAILMQEAFRGIIDADRSLQQDLTDHIVIILTIASSIPGVFTENFACLHTKY
jgi:hypothetical protein